jgi:hypothetical protein
LHRSNIEQQHRPILDQPPANWIYDRNNESLTAKLGQTDANSLPRPVALLGPGKGAIVRNDVSASAEAMLTCLALVSSRLPQTLRSITCRRATNKRC